MVENLTIKHFPRVHKDSGNGNFVIYTRVTLKREKFEFSTRQTITSLNIWESKTQRLKLKSSVNTVLSELEHKIHEAYNFLKYHNKPLTMNNLRRQLNDKTSPKQRFIDFVNGHFEKNVLKNPEFAHATKQTYRTTINHLKDFLDESGQTRIWLVEVNLEFLKNFDNFLLHRDIRRGKSVNRNSATKYHINLKSMLNKAVEKRLLEVNPYNDFKLKKQQGGLTFLTEVELSRLEKIDLSFNQSLERVLDIFLFSVYTGLRNSDSNVLKDESIEFDGNRFWITYTQKKTKDYNRIPMLKKAEVIYQKYKQERMITGYVLPRISHQKINSYLKIIADLAGIKKKLSHHVARHTAATTILMQNGISLENTGKILGHRSLKTTMIYAKVTNIMLQNVADRIDEKI